MIVGFDLLWLLGLPLAWGPGLLLASLPVSLGWRVAPWLGIALAPLGYGLFLLGVVLMLGLLARITPKEREGSSKVFVDRDFFAFLLRWGLEKYLPSPLLDHVHLITALRTLHYKLQGAQLGWSTHISPGARVWTPSLVRLGHLTYLGDFVLLSAHLSQSDKLVLAPIEIGDRTNIGASCRVAPGCRIGARVRLGALCDLAPGVEIDDEVEVGPACQMGMGVKIGARARIEPRSYLPSWSTVPAGEVWEGAPARRVGFVRDSAGERRKQARRRGERPA